VTLRKAAATGQHRGTLTVSTDGDPGEVNIDILANVIADSTGSQKAEKAADSEDKSKDKFPFGCTLANQPQYFDPTFLILLTLAMLWLARRNRVC
jgi:hypothetical protein